ncbi:hypothetical protein WJX84_001677 [Apatococcus fuscideae]|uniref:PKS/mFAS DH domain-containing protein n=1 Tax=Apatococcus fuscideae TaxID=2026836 RepID=A0AAW1TDT0_9CHLO
MPISSNDLSFPGVAIQRQQAPIPNFSTSSSAAGISAFAFQGTNAHIVLLPDAAGSTSRGSHPPRQAAEWQHGRYWYLPPPHSLLACFSWCSPSQQAQWDLQLGQPKQSFLWDHQVSGRILFPAAAMLEATRSAGAYLLDGVKTPSVSLILLHAAIPAAFELPSPSSSTPAHALSARVLVDVSGNTIGSTSMRSTSVSGMAVTHLRASLASCQSLASHGSPALDPKTKDQPSSKLSSHASPLRAAQKVVAAVFAGNKPQGLGRLQGVSDNGNLGGMERVACPVAEASSPSEAGQGFSIHPAAADSCMHVGTLCGTPDGRIRVPGALGAFLAEPLGSQAAASGSGRWAIGVGDIRLHRPVTSSAQGPPDRSSAQLCGSFLASLVRVAAAEMPGHTWRVTAADLQGRPAAALEPSGPFDEHRVENGTMWQPALKETSRASHAGATEASSNAENYAISGGVGALGLLMAHWACQHTAGPCLSLLSRGGRGGDQTSLTSLIGPGSQGLVMICKGDVGCSADSRLAFGCGQKSLASILLHAGGVLSDGLIAKQTPAKLRAVCAPKGRACKSVQWGPWGGGGMAAGDLVLAARLERSGLRLLSPTAGLQALATAAFDYPTIQALASHIAGQLKPSTTAPSQQRRQAAARVALPASTSAQADGPDRAAILSELAAIVSSIVGADVAADQPLMQACAGLALLS